MWQTEDATIADDRHAGLRQHPLRQRPHAHHDRLRARTTPRSRSRRASAQLDQLTDVPTAAGRGADRADRLRALRSRRRPRLVTRHRRRPPPPADRRPQRRRRPAGREGGRPGRGLRHPAATADAHDPQADAAGRPPADDRAGGRPPRRLASTRRCCRSATSPTRSSTPSPTTCAPGSASATPSSPSRSTPPVRSASPRSRAASTTRSSS